MKNLFLNLRNYYTPFSKSLELVCIFLVQKKTKQIGDGREYLMVKNYIIDIFFTPFSPTPQFKKKK